MRLRSVPSATAQPAAVLSSVALSATALLAATLTAVPASASTHSSASSGVHAVNTGSPRADDASADFVTDDQGRVIILHGLNTASSAKGPSGLPWIDHADVAREARDLGTNSVRYLIQWKNVEPTPGVFDDAYLGEVARRVGWYGQHGMYVILDMHQDVYGPATCGGNGAPPWATITDGAGCTPQSQWELDYLQPGTLNAFDNFWNYGGKHPELMTAYIAMWQHVARYFAKNRAVLGYDLMNEPFGGIRQLGFFEGPVLTPFYQRLVNAIRTVDANGWIFAEPASIAANQGLPSGLGRLTDPRHGRPRIAFAPHLYPIALDLGGSYSGLTRLTIQAEMALWRRSMAATARRLRMPMWVGEYGNVTPGDASYLDDTTSLFDQMNVAGWAYWSNDQTSTGPYDHGWTPLATHLARPYPRAVAGTPTKISFSGHAFTMAWKRRPGATGPTEIWLPPADFPTTPHVTLTDGTSQWNPATRILSVWSSPKAAEHLATVTS